MAQPTLVLVHGSWHSPQHFEPLITQLRKQGYQTIAVSLPSTQSRSEAPHTFADDTAAVREAILAPLDAGENVLVVAHSYGGAPTSNALRDLSVSARQAEGKETGIIGVAYLCAALLPAEISFLDALGGEPMAIHDLSANDGFCTVGEPGPAHYFYNDLFADEAEYWSSLLRPQAWIAYEDKLTYTPYAEMPVHYLYCTEDQALVIEAQKGMVAQVEAAARCQVRTEEVQSSHSPFLSMPERTAEFIRRSAGEAI